MAARAGSVAESVKARRDRRPPLKLAAFASGPAQASKIPQKRQTAHKTAVSSSGPKRRGKTVTNRRKASDRSHESVGELLRRKALAAVLKASVAKYKQQKRQRKGTAEPSDTSDGSLTHQAIRKYVEEQLDDGSKLAGANLTTELRMAKDSLKQVGLTVSDVKRVRLASDTDVALTELEDDDEVCEEAAANLLSKHPLPETPRSKPKSARARDGSRTRSKSVSARQAVSGGRDHELTSDEDEMVSDADAQMAEASDAEYEPASGRPGRKKGKARPQASATKAPKKRVKLAKPKKSDALSDLRKDQLIARVKSLEAQVAAATPQEAGPELADVDEEAPLVEAKRELTELTEANRHWRATAIILRRRLAQHEDVSDIDCDEQEALGSAVRDDASAGDAHSVAGPSSPEQQMFDAYVDARAVASGSGDVAVAHPDDGAGFATPDFPQLEFETDDNGSPRSNGKGKGRAFLSEAASVLGASSSGPFHGVASSSSPTKSCVDRASSPFGRTEHAVTEPSSPFSSPTRAPVQGSLLDNVGQKALQDEQLRSTALKEELALATRAYQEQAIELAAFKSVVDNLRVKLVATDAARTAAFQSAESKSSGHQALSDCVKEYADALRDANKRVCALEADIEEHEKRAKTRELDLVSAQAEYEGVLAQERCAHAEAAEASERVKALEAALQQSKAEALALAAQSSTSEELEAVRKQRNDAITERDRARFEIARLKTSCAEYEIAVDKSSRELGDLTADRNRLAAECERLAAEKEHETEALDLSMEQRRVVELERDRLRQALGEKEQEVERVARSHQVATQLDQQTITEMTHTTSEQAARIEELQEAPASLRSRAEEAEQERANAQVLLEEVAEWREKYEQAEAARAAQEGDHAAQACRLTEVETALHKLELRLLDSEAETSRAAAQVDEMRADCRNLKEEHARLATRIRHALESLGVSANSDANDDISLLLDSVFQQVEQEAGRLQQVAVENTSRLDLLNFATSFARDIVALLPGNDATAQTTSSLERLLAAILTGVRDLHAARVQALDESDAATEAIDAQRLTMIGMLHTLQDVVSSGEPSELANEADPDRAVTPEDLTTLARTTVRLVDKLVESFKTLDERYGALEQALRKSDEEWEARQVELVDRQRKIKSLTEDLEAARATRRVLEEWIHQCPVLVGSLPKSTPAAAVDGAHGTSSAMEASQRPNGDA